MNIPDLYVCKRLVMEEIQRRGWDTRRYEPTDILRIAKALQRSIRPLVERELSEPKRLRSDKHVERLVRSHSGGSDAQG